MLARLRRHLTYANVVSSLCLFAVLGGGTAYAAITITGKNVKNGSLTGTDIKNNSLTGADVKSLTTGDFKAGSLPAGPRGAIGPAGPQGSAGVDGSSAASINTGLVESNQTGNYFGTPSGATRGVTDESTVQTVTPAGQSITARDLSAQLPYTAAGSGTWTVALRVQAQDSALQCSITAGSSACQDTTHVVTIPPNSRISIRSGFTAPGGAYQGVAMKFGWRAAQ